MAKKAPKTTLKDIAKQLDLTATTVSRVLSGRAAKYRISKNTEEKVLSAAKKANFTPNQIARSLRIRKTYTIGLIVPDIANPFFSTIAQIIESEARKEDYAIILCDSSENTSIEIKCVDLLESRDVDGLIISPVGKENGHISNLFEKNRSIVLIDRYFPNLKIPFVASDNYRGAFEAVNHLIECGHNKIACIQGFVNTFTSQERLRGYKSALESKNIKVQDNFIKGNSFDMENGYLSTKLLLNQLCIPTAIFTHSNLIALGALSAIKEEGYKVPDDISIITFDDELYTASLSTPLSAVKQRSMEIGQIAVRMLMDQMEHGHPKTPERILLPTFIIHRDSVRIIPPQL